MKQNKSEKQFFEKQNLNGWLNFNKPKNFSSSDCVNKIKSILKARKVGHAGTLDPMATGVLPIALGEATKAIRFIMESEKTYSFKKLNKSQNQVKISTKDTFYLEIIKEN